MQCPAHWTGIQLMISPGKNPLSAVVWLKYAVSDDNIDNDEFYGLNIVDKFDNEVMERHMYRDPVRFGVQIVLSRSLINIFTTFHYEQDPNTKDFAAHFPFHHEQMLRPFIHVIQDEFGYYFIDMKNHLDQMEAKGDVDAQRVLCYEMQMLQSAKKMITTGNIAELILKCADTFQAKKNWNSHGTSVGDLSTIIYIVTNDKSLFG